MIPDDSRLFRSTCVHVECIYELHAPWGIVHMDRSWGVLVLPVAAVDADDSDSTALTD